MPIITSIINVSSEGSIARPTIESALLAAEFSRVRGVDVETLIIADRPSAETQAALEPYKTRVKIVEINVGDLGEARNRGASIARGEFIGFLDGDDLWGKHWLYKAWTAAKDDVRLIVHPQYNVIFGCGQDHIFEHLSMTAPRFNKRYLIFDNYWTALSFSRKGTYLSIPYQRNDIAAGFGYEDWKWNCDTIRANYLHVVAEDTFHLIRRRNGSLRARSNLANALPLPSARFFEQQDSQEQSNLGETRVRTTGKEGAPTGTAISYHKRVGTTIASRHTFQSFWWGDVISPYEAFCMRSFVDHGHDYDLYSYHPEIKVPAGVRIRDAAELLPITDFFTYEDGPGAGSPSAFSNLFRYKLLATRGGWWVDTDVVCLADVIPKFDQFFAFEDENFVATAVLYFRPQNPVMLCAFETAWRLRENISWGQTGPQLITALIDGLGLHDENRPRDVCYPVHWKEAADLLSPSEAVSLEKRTHSSLFLHLWNEVLRRRGVDKNLLPPTGSFLRQLADRHPVEGWRGVQVEV
jgi:glycosyltransferase involved in cell wall biosynthesis